MTTLLQDFETAYAQKTLAEKRAPWTFVFVLRDVLDAALARLSTESKDHPRVQALRDQITPALIQQMTNLQNAHAQNNQEAFEAIRQLARKPYQALCDSIKSIKFGFFESKREFAEFIKKLQATMSDQLGANQEFHWIPQEVGDRDLAGGNGTIPTLDTPIPESPFSLTPSGKLLKLINQGASYAKMHPQQRNYPDRPDLFLEGRFVPQNIAEVRTALDFVFNQAFPEGLDFELAHQGKAKKALLPTFKSTIAQRAEADQAKRAELFVKLEKLKAITDPPEFKTNKHKVLGRMGKYEKFRKIWLPDFYSTLPKHSALRDQWDLFIQALDVQGIEGLKPKIETEVPVVAHTFVEEDLIALSQSPFHLSLTLQVGAAFSPEEHERAQFNTENLNTTVPAIRKTQKISHMWLRTVSTQRDILNLLSETLQSSENPVDQIEMIKDRMKEILKSLQQTHGQLSIDLQTGDPINEARRVGNQLVDVFDSHGQKKVLTRTLSSCLVDVSKTVNERAITEWKRELDLAKLWSVLTILKRRQMPSSQEQLLLTLSTDLKFVLDSLEEDRKIERKHTCEIEGDLTDPNLQNWLNLGSVLIPDEAFSEQDLMDQINQRLEYFKSVDRAIFPEDAPALDPIPNPIPAAPGLRFKEELEEVTQIPSMAENTRDAIEALAAGEPLSTVAMRDGIPKYFAKSTQYKSQEGRHLVTLHQLNWKNPEPKNQTDSYSPEKLLRTELEERAESNAQRRITEPSELDNQIFKLKKVSEALQRYLDGRQVDGKQTPEGMVYRARKLKGWSLMGWSKVKLNCFDLEQTYKNIQSAKEIRKLIDHFNHSKAATASTADWETLKTQLESHMQNVAKTGRLRDLYNEAVKQNAFTFAVQTTAVATPAPARAQAPATTRIWCGSIDEFDSESPEELERTDLDAAANQAVSAVIEPGVSARRTMLSREKSDRRLTAPGTVRRSSSFAAFGAGLGEAGRGDPAASKPVSTVTSVFI